MAGRPNVNWTEHTADGALTLEFTGVDADRRDAAELATFKRALAEPSPGDDSTRRDRLGDLPAALFRLGFTVVGLLVGVGLVKLANAVATALGWSLPMEVDLALFAGGFAAAMVGGFSLTGSARMSIGRPRRAASGSPFEDVFAVTFDGSTVSMRGTTSSSQSFPLSEIDRFEDGSRIALVSVGGQRHSLVCGLPFRADQAVLVSRLNELLVAARAARGGYRGARVSALADPLPDPQEPRARSRRA
jgi:hypothetical protein